MPIETDSTIYPAIVLYEHTGRFIEYLLISNGKAS